MIELPEVQGMTARFDVLVSAVSNRTSNREVPITFPDHLAYEVNFFAEFAEKNVYLLGGEVSYFVDGLSRYLSRDVILTGIRTGCFILFFSIDDFEFSDFMKIRDQDRFLRILYNSNISLFYAGEDFLLTRSDRLGEGYRLRTRNQGRIQ